MLNFPAKFLPDPGGGFTVTFRDIPEAITQGDDLKDAALMAVDALITVFESYFKDKRKIPAPSLPIDNEVVIELPVSLTVKIELLNLLTEHKIKQTHLADRLGILKQEVNRFTNLRHTTKIDTLSDAFNALGFELEFTVNKIIER